MSSRGYNIELRTGAVAMYRRHGLLGWAITLFTGGKWSHAGIIIVDGGRHYVLDSRSPACDVRPISVDVRGGLHIRILRVPHDVTWDAPALIDFAYQIEGHAPYALWRMLKNTWALIFGGAAGAPDAAVPPSDFFCSELASACCRMFARWADDTPYDPCPTHPDRFTTPYLLADSSSLVTQTDRLAFDTKDDR